MTTPAGAKLATRELIAQAYRLSREHQQEFERSRVLADQSDRGELWGTQGECGTQGAACAGGGTERMGHSTTRTPPQRTVVAEATAITSPSECPTIPDLTGQTRDGHTAGQTGQGAREDPHLPNNLHLPHNLSNTMERKGETQGRWRG